jgi:hypothetical protein
MLVVILIFVILLLVAYGAYALLPHPFDVIVAGIIALVAVVYLVTHLDTLEDADAALASAAAVCRWRLP